jgi:hypothetical protein
MFQEAAAGEVKDLVPLQRGLMVEDEVLQCFP